MHVKTAFIWTLAASLLLGSLPAQAGLIATPELAAPADGAARDRLAAALARADVAQALRAQGVDPAAVAARVAALSDDEAALVAQRLEALPAGGSDVLGAIVFIFVLLLITDILGFTKVFPFTRPIR
jgi:hypothetical protein